MAKRTRSIDGVRRRYVWRLYPTPAQAAQLREQAQMCADLWNALLEMIETRYGRAVQRYGKSISYHCADCATRSESAGRMMLCDQHRLPSEFDLGNWISVPGTRVLKNGDYKAPSPEGHLLRDCPEWNELSTWTPRRVATSLIAAFKAFFRRVKEGEEEPGYPRYKSRMRHLSIPHRSVSGCRLWRGGPAWRSYRHRDNWSLSLKGVDGPIRASRSFDGEITEWTDVDIICRNGRWEANIAVVAKPWRRGGNEAVTVRLDLVDGLALVNGQMQTPDELLDAQLLQEQYDEQQSDHDRRWPPGCVLTDEQRQERRENRERLSRFAARIARKRKNALHGWSAAIVRRASGLIVLSPKIKDTSKSAAGQKQTYGAYAVDAATEINRVALGYAPAIAVAMLAYKAKEAGISLRIMDDPDAPYLERLRLLEAGERSNQTKKSGSARRKIRSNRNGVGLDEHVLPAGVAIL